MRAILLKTAIILVVLVALLVLLYRLGGDGGALPFAYEGFD